MGYDHLGKELPGWPREMHTVARFKDLGGRTEVTIEWTPVDGSSESELRTFEAGRDSMKMGWTGTLDNLAAFVANLKNVAEK